MSQLSWENMCLNTPKHIKTETEKLCVFGLTRSVSTFRSFYVLMFLKTDFLSFTKMKEIVSRNKAANP